MATKTKKASSTALVQAETDMVQTRTPGGRLTKRSLVKLQKSKYMDNAEAILDALFPAIIEGLLDRDSKIVDRVLEMNGYISSGKGPAFVNNIINQNNNKSESNTYNNSFDALVRRLDSRDFTENEKPVIDLEAAEDVD